MFLEVLEEPKPRLEPVVDFLKTLPVRRVREPAAQFHRKGFLLKVNVEAVRGTTHNTPHQAASFHRRANQNAYLVRFPTRLKVALRLVLNDQAVIEKEACLQGGRPGLIIGDGGFSKREAQGIVLVQGPTADKPEKDNKKAQPTKNPTRNGT